MSDALVAALMMQQRQRQQFDPAENSRRYGQALMQHGASTAPVQSPLEGLARALQGGVGGFFEGQAEREQKETQTKTTDKLARALGAKDEASRNAILNEPGGDPNILAPFYAQTLAQKIADDRKNGLLDTKLDASGVSRGGGAGQPGPSGNQPGLTIDVTPLPSGTPAPGAFNNNLGNIRAGVGFPGEGAPQNGFATFGSPQQGANAMVQNLGAYIKQNPNMTVAQAIAKWAPPNENNTQQYISQVAEGTGINPGMPLGEVMKDPAVAATLLDAITRKEKGGLPQGVTADTFMAATGGQPQAQQQTPVQLAQGAEGAMPQPQAAPQAPPAPTIPEVSPAAQHLMQQAQQARAGGDRERALALVQKAQEAQAAYVQERAKTQDTRAYDQSKTAEQRTAEAAEHDRREANKPMTKEQSDAAVFADRMTNSFRILGQNEKEGLSTKGRALDSKVFGVGVPGANYAQSEGYQKFRQAKDDFINAQLRRESGAVISDQEYAAADKQYFPQPGDAESVVAQKMKNRQLAVEGMTRAAGKTYTLNPTVNQPPAGTTAPAQGGAPQPGSVMDGYRFKGGNPADKSNWEPAQ